jgi:hypothetical protein
MRKTEKKTITYFTSVSESFGDIAYAIGYKLNTIAKVHDTIVTMMVIKEMKEK